MRVEGDVELPRLGHGHARNAAGDQQDVIGTICLGGAQGQTGLLERILDLSGVGAVELHPPAQDGMDSETELFGNGAALGGLVFGTNVSGFNAVKTGLLQRLQARSRSLGR